MRETRAARRPTAVVNALAHGADESADAARRAEAINRARAKMQAARAERTGLREEVVAAIGRARAAIERPEG